MRYDSISQVKKCMHSTQRQVLPGTELLRLARGSIKHGLAHGEPLPVDRDEIQQALADPAATFTTLHLADELRGCSGSLEAKRPLAIDVTHSAFQAAFLDPRFDPVSEADVGAIRLEVAVLSSLESIAVADEAELLDRLMPGVDGLVIVVDGRHATFLPKVWDMLPEPRQFLTALKVKCGLKEDYWSERLEFRRYSTTSFAD